MKYDFKNGSLQMQSCDYDGLDRLTGASAVGGSQGPYPQESYACAADTDNLSSMAGVSYSYNTQVSCEAGNRTIAHDVSAAGGNIYRYDCNGNMTQRMTGGATYALTYYAEIRLIPG